MRPTVYQIGLKQGDESIMQMMARIQSEITTDSIADQWQSKLEEFGVVF